AQAGCRVFSVHARNAWLKGLSPKENREVPPLRYETVHRLKRDFPDLVIVTNGGITTTAQARAELLELDGFMAGRVAYHDPWWLASWDATFFGEPQADVTREEIEHRLCDYMAREKRLHGTSWHAVARHM